MAASERIAIDGVTYIVKFIAGYNAKMGTGEQYGVKDYNISFRDDIPGKRVSVLPCGAVHYGSSVDHPVASSIHRRVMEEYMMRETHSFAIWLNEDITRLQFAA